MARNSTKNNSESKTIELALPKFDSRDGTKGIDSVSERFPISIDKVTDWFKLYQVDSIELWISGVLGTGTITMLDVTASERIEGSV